MKGNEKVDDFLKGKVIPGYWNAVFSNSALVDDITEEDEKALESLIDVENVYDPDDHESFALKFVFKDNKYFKEKELTRKAKCSNGEILCIEGTPITWKEGQSLTLTLRNIYPY